MVSDEIMIESTIERMSSVKTESLSSSEMMEPVRVREVVSDQSKELLELKESEERGLLPRGVELDCSSCLLQEQMKEGNYELVSKVATSGWHKLRGIIRS